MSYLGGNGEATAQTEVQADERHDSACPAAERGTCQQPREVLSDDPAVLRAALIRESAERRRAECRANIQTEVVKHALDLLVREPDIEGFFGALSKTMVVESESHTCAVWLIDEDVQHCELWMAFVKERLFMPSKTDTANEACRSGKSAFPCERMAKHLFEYAEGWNQTIEYKGDDQR